MKILWYEGGLGRGVGRGEGGPGSTGGAGKGGWKERMKQRQKYWSLSHGFKFGRKLADWSKSDEQEVVPCPLTHPLVVNLPRKLARTVKPSQGLAV